MYLSPLITSEPFKGLKRHITLMVHSAGSAIFAEFWDETHSTNKILFRKRPGKNTRSRTPIQSWIIAQATLPSVSRCCVYPLLQWTGITSSPIWQPWYRRLSGSVSVAGSQTPGDVTSAANGYIISSLS